MRFFEGMAKKNPAGFGIRLVVSEPGGGVRFFELFVCLIL
jgi:hypothetical protein